MRGISWKSPTVDEYTRLVSLAVHELRSPLSVVGGYLRMLRDDTKADDAERRRRLIEEAERACRRIGGLLEELSELTKMDSGAVTLASETFDLFALVRDIVESLPAESGEEARLEAAGPTEGAKVTGDRTRLRAALACAMRTVRREHGPATTVIVDMRLATERRQRVALVVVAPAAEIEGARQAAPGPVNEARGGVGLCLPIARRVIARSGGRIWSPAEPEGQTPGGAASAFLIVLPLAR
jgi:signal transduction histidine kinase